MGLYRAMNDVNIFNYLLHVVRIDSLRETTKKMETQLDVLKRDCEPDGSGFDRHEEKKKEKTKRKLEISFVGLSCRSPFPTHE